MTKKQKKKLRKIVISAVLLVAITVVFKLAGEDITGKEAADKLIRLAAYLIPYLIVGATVLKKAGQNIINGQVFDENFLMCIATIGAFALGEYAEAVAVLLFYQVGELFENIAVARSRQSISALVSIRPDYANVEIDGELKKVDPNDVKIGDTIVVLAGEKVPLDGVVIEGETFVNTSALTGESVPRKVSKGDEILSGCINEQGRICIKVSKAFEESTVSKILDMVQNASSKKSRSENFITRFARIYTPIVVLVAVLVAVVPPVVLSESFIKWIERALLFLVVSCPCALVISVPLGFFGGIGSASKNGILVKGSNYLEAIAAADTIVFDKTGTLTKGVFRVQSVVAFDDIDELELLKKAAYVECFSNHPIAKSIISCYEEKGCKIDGELIEDVKEISGKGVMVRLPDGIFGAGNIRLLQEKNIDTTGINISEAKEGTVVYIISDEKCLGYIVIADEIKDGAKAAIEALHAQGIKNSVILTGDRQSTAFSVANKLGIKTVYSELLPADKLEKLEEIIEADKDGQVVFVGDGINDAPSLTRADVGVAMGALGQDAAIEAADIVLMDDKPEKIAVVQRIGRKTLTIVKENIIFALTVKLLVMVLGVIGMASMWHAVFADVGVSVIAILNSMRMLKYKG